MFAPTSRGISKDMIVGPSIPCRDDRTRTGACPHPQFTKFPLSCINPPKPWRRGRSRVIPNEFVRVALASIQQRWHTRSGLVVGLALAAAVLLFAFAGVDLANVSRSEIAISVVALIGIALAWWWTRLPGAGRGKVGFGVAIDYETDAEAQQLRSDFVGMLRRLLDASQGLRHKFDFIEFDRRIARQLTRDQAVELSRQTRCHFVLYGTSRSRLLGGERRQVIDLSGIVRHGPLDEDVKRLFGVEFSELLPSRVIVGEQNSLIGYEFAARHIDIVARYIIGSAAFITGDAPYAEGLLRDAKARLEQLDRSATGPLFATLRNRIPVRLSQVYEVLLYRASSRYTFRREPEAIAEMDAIVTRRRSVIEDNYRTKLSAAQCEFLLRHDVAAARREIRACRRFQDGAWRYSEAFLHAYEGDLQRAYISYRAAFQAPLEDPSVPIQCEEFIHLVLNDEPEKYWLHFCLGLLNHRVKGDLVAARRDFETFLNRVESGRFVVQADVVRTWLAEIDGNAA
jgi:hypothetical protein